MNMRDTPNGRAEQLRDKLVEYRSRITNHMHDSPFMEGIELAKVFLLEQLFNTSAVSYDAARLSITEGPTAALVFEEWEGVTAFDVAWSVIEAYIYRNGAGNWNGTGLPKENVV
jgi:hypothetical protein